MDEQAERRLELRQQFNDFLDQDHGLGTYPDKIKALLTRDNIARNRLRLEVDVHDLRQYSDALYRSLLADPAEAIPQFEEALENIVRNSNPKALQDGQTVRVGFTGEFGPNRVSPRELTSGQISSLVNLEGIITNCSLVRPKMVKSVHYCEATGQFKTQQYRDAASLEGNPTSSVFPTRDDEGNPLTTEFGLCQYRDHQLITVQELPETAPPGQLPRSAEVMLEDDLVDAAKPGDRVSLVGVYRALPPRAQGSVSGTFRAVLLANSVRQLANDTASSKITVDDIRNIEALAGEPDVLQQLAASLAPSIYGHKAIKTGLVLLLLGGRERDLANGTHLRGDVNCLLVGDPGVAKSQLLRAMMTVAPLAVSTTGRGSSGVGLTAAVTHDKDTGERRLEAGAMVLADRGIVCIDEFDKMNDLDRVAIHEVMEQQTVTIAKAGIQMSLNARCSVLAAANPLYGSYDESLSATKNINLPDSLLSRFDLLFVVLDNLTAEQDRAIASHVVGQHRYRTAGDDGRTAVAEGPARMEEAEEEEEEATQPKAAEMYCKYNAVLHGPLPPGGKPPLSVAFLRKFLTIVKRRGSELTLTPDAAEAVADFYSELRSASSQENALPVTVRTLETIIRLSTAAAKARLAPGVELRDVEAAKALMGAMLSGNLEALELAPPPAAAELEAPAAAAALPAQREGGRARRSAAAKRRREQSPAGSNDENDPGAGNVRRVRAAPAPAGGEPAGASGSAPPLTDLQLERVREGVLAMLKARSWTGTGTVPALQATLSIAGHELSESALVRALEVMTQERAEDGDAPPIFFDSEDGKFYEV